MKSVASRRVLACLAVGVLFLTAACTSAVNQAAQTAVSGPPAAGGTLVIANSTDAQPGSFMSPALGNVLTEYAVFETLTLIDPNTGQPQGVLAKSWKMAPDGRSMSVQLLDDVTFHSGRKMTSADVIYSLRQMQNPAVSPQGQFIASQISGMKANGDYEVDLTFKRPLPNIFDLFEIMPIVNKDTFGQISSGKVVDGTGRFMWKSWTPGDKIVLQKYDNYRDAKDTHLDTIEIDTITDPTAELAAIRSGRVQYAVGLSPLDARTLGQQSGYALVQSGGSALPLAFDVTKAPFNNKAVRQAVEYAIDRSRVVQQVEGRLGDATDLPWKTSTPGYNTSLAGTYTYQPGKARQMLAAAGVKAGTSFNVVVPNFPESVEMFQIIKNDLAAVGLNATAQVISSTDYDQRIANGNLGAPAFLMRNGNGFSPASAVEARPELRATGNVEHFQSAEYTGLAQALTTAVSPGQQEKALSAYDAYFLNQAFAVPVIVRKTLSVRASTVGGITTTQQGFLNVSTAYLAK